MSTSKKVFFPLREANKVLLFYFLSGRVDEEERKGLKNIIIIRGKVSNVFALSIERQLVRWDLYSVLQYDTRSKHLQVAKRLLE